MAWGRRTPSGWPKRASRPAVAGSCYSKASTRSPPARPAALPSSSPSRRCEDRSRVRRAVPCGPLRQLDQPEACARVACLAQGARLPRDRQLAGRRHRHRRGGAGAGNAVVRHPRDGEQAALAGRAILDWARVRGYRPDGANPARWRGHLDHLLPARKHLERVKHHAALPYSRGARLHARAAPARGDRGASAGIRYFDLRACQ